MAQTQTYTHESGREYCLGCNPMTVRTSQMRVYGDVPDQVVIPRAAWPAMIKAGSGDMGGAVRQILDQGNEGTCWEFSMHQAHMVARTLQGYNNVILDCSVCPTLIGGWNGNSIDAALVDFDLVYGCPPMSIIPRSDPTRGLYNRVQSSYPADWKVHAAQYKPQEWLHCPSFDELASAILSGHPGGMGVSWQGGGHALCVLQLVLETNGTYSLAGPNSWGTSFDSGWGAYGSSRPGWYKLSEAQVKRGLGTFGAYALVSVSPPEGQDTAPAAK